MHYQEPKPSWFTPKQENVGSLLDLITHRQTSSSIASTTRSSCTQKPKSKWSTQKQNFESLLHRMAHGKTSSSSLFHYYQESKPTWSSKKQLLGHSLSMLSFFELFSDFWLSGWSITSLAGTRFDWSLESLLLVTYGVNSKIFSVGWVEYKGLLQIHGNSSLMNLFCCKKIVGLIKGVFHSH